MLKPVTLGEARLAVEGQPAKGVQLWFDYLGQRGVLPEVGLTFPLWPMYQMQEIREFSEFEAMDFWMVVARHWGHTSFLFEPWVAKKRCGFVCVQCGCRVSIPVHTYVSVPLKGDAHTGYARIDERRKLFELRRKWELGLTMKLWDRKLAEAIKPDRFLDSW